MLFAWVAVVLAVAMGVGACGPTKAATSAIDDIARISRHQSDEVGRLATLDDQLARGPAIQPVSSAQWATKFEDAASTYRTVPSEGRSAVCGVATNWLEATFVEGSTTSSDLMSLTLQEVATLNQSAAGHALANDLDSVLQKRSAGEPYALALLFIKTATCQALSQ